MSDGLPPAGWYPDPLGRHAERHWDGAEWSSRVRDGSLESHDPLDGSGQAGDRRETATSADPLDALLTESAGDTPPSGPTSGGSALDVLAGGSLVGGSGPDVGAVEQEVFGTTDAPSPQASRPIAVAPEPAARPTPDPSASGVAGTSVGATTGPSAGVAMRTSANRSTRAVVARIVALVAVLLFLLAGVQMLGLESEAGNTVAEAFYNAVGLLSIAFGLTVAAYFTRD